MEKKALRGNLFFRKNLRHSIAARKKKKRYETTLKPYQSQLKKESMPFIIKVSLRSLAALKCDVQAAKSPIKSLSEGRFELPDAKPITFLSHKSILGGLHKRYEKRLRKIAEMVAIKERSGKAKKGKSI